MAKTRAQTRVLSIKKEEAEDCKPTLLLKRVGNTRSNNKLTKRKAPKSNTSILPTQEIKKEENTDTKLLLQSIPKPPKLPKGRYISQEQINQLIDYVVNQGMSVAEASRKVNMSYHTGLHYYNEYKNDPDKRIPVPRNQRMHPPIFSTQEQIENLIRYINNGKINIKKASAKANMHYQSGKYYYKKYLQDPNHSIPTPQLYQHYTQDQRDEFIDCLVNDKMSIKAASKQAKISADTGRRYYRKYIHDRDPALSHIATYTRYTQKQKKEVISYIIDDKMTIAAASRKVKMDCGMASIYYRRYLKANNMENPVSKRHKRYTPDGINQLVGYIVDDKMSLTAASKKANMHYATGKKYYRKYLDGQKRDTSI